MMTADLFITISTARAQYVLRRDQVSELRRITGPADLERPDLRGKPMSSQELGPLLDPADIASRPGCHAVIVPTRRRGLALLVERVDTLHQDDESRIYPLPALLARHLSRPWYLGVMLRGATPLLLLDLRQIAQYVLLRDAEARSSSKVSVSAKGESYGPDSDSNA
jgi:hypothetical protein